MSQPSNTERVGAEWDRRERSLDRRFLLLLIGCVAGMAVVLVVMTSWFNDWSRRSGNTGGFFTQMASDPITETTQAIRQTDWYVNPDPNGEFPTTAPSSIAGMKDAWGQHINYQWPPPTGDEYTGQRKYKPAIWSNGPNQINEQGGGDDIPNWNYKAPAKSRDSNEIEDAVEAD